MSCETQLPDVSQWLVYESQFMDASLPTGLWFCENAEAVQAVGVNAVCLSSGAGWNDLYQCADFIRQFPYVLIVAADPTRRKRLTEELRPRLSYITLLEAQKESFRGCASVRELRETCGPKAVEEILLYNVELPAYGLVSMEAIKAPEVWRMPKALSGIPELDRATGGFLMGEVSVWTGKRGDGKSTLLNQLLLRAIDQGHRVCAYSGELPDWRFRSWAMLQAAGPRHLKMCTDPDTGKCLFHVPKPVQDRIDEWWQGQFFLYDLGIAAAHDEDSILNVFTQARRRFGCDVFLVDNIMTAGLKGGRNADYYRAQSSFVGRLVTFAKRNGVHVHLVAHPRKAGSGGNGVLDADDVSGAGDITNRADNVFTLKRVPEEAGKEYSCVLEILKNRAFGSRAKIGLGYEPNSRRYYKSGSGTPDWDFGWYGSEQVGFTELDGEATPFDGEGQQ